MSPVSFSTKLVTVLCDGESIKIRCKDDTSIFYLTRAVAGKKCYCPYSSILKMGQTTLDPLSMADQIPNGTVLTFIGRKTLLVHG